MSLPLVLVVVSIMVSAISIIFFVAKKESEALRIAVVSATISAIACVLAIVQLIGGFKL